ncbi:hypothetical protein EXIGLDRAFT_717976 [Exidia glandulosa HHB12029]|uniref:Glycopeptide n=1 Tax=Exidia glandulosa HHB12029 TaxID=1314781 RepID=A0A165P3D7_EXIGL|nr:hypothetical protein EXIGLDRAFT_717976 [Exidia glandulosa HHB12029]
MFKLTASLALLVSLASTVSAEQHTFVFDNRCGFGAPALVQNGRVLFVSNGPIHNYDAFTVGNSLVNFTSFLSSGSCSTSGNPTGTNCTVVHGTLALPGQGGSSVQINAVDGGFPTTFAYTGGSGSGCWDGYSSNGLTGAGPVETCAANDVNLAIRFC